MAGTVWRPSKGREVEDIVTKLNELINAVNAPTVGQGNVKPYQNIASIKNADGTHTLQIRTKDGLMQSDPTSTTGWKLI